MRIFAGEDNLRGKFHILGARLEMPMRQKMNKRAYRPYLFLAVRGSTPNKPKTTDGTMKRTTIPNAINPPCRGS